MGPPMASFRKFQGADQENSKGPHDRQATTYTSRATNTSHTPHVHTTPLTRNTIFVQLRASKHSHIHIYFPLPSMQLTTTHTAAHMAAVKVRACESSANTACPLKACRGRTGAREVPKPCGEEAWLEFCKAKAPQIAGSNGIVEARLRTQGMARGTFSSSLHTI